MTVAGNVQCNTSLDSQSSEKFLNCFKAHSALINSNTHPPVSLQGLFHSKAAYFLPVLSALLLICFCFKWTHAFVIVYFLFFLSFAVELRRRVCELIQVSFFLQLLKQFQYLVGLILCIH